jgi:GR25 family glycosyltransferase involved in LPS biosynthesis
MLQIPDNDILVLEDDVVLCDDFLGKLNHFLHRITYEQCIDSEFNVNASNINKPFAFTPIYIPEKKCNYTPVKSEKCFASVGYEVFTQKYVDGIFFMNRTLHHEVKDWFIHEEVPVLKSSSGIGKFLSQKMYRAKFNMYGISPSMIGHGDHESIQFGEKRKQVPLIAKI